MSQASEMMHHFNKETIIKLHFRTVIKIQDGIKRKSSLSSRFNFLLCAAFTLLV